MGVNSLTASVIYFACSLFSLFSSGMPVTYRWGSFFRTLFSECMVCKHLRLCLRLVFRVWGNQFCFSLNVASMVPANLWPVLTLTSDYSKSVILRNLIWDWGPGISDLVMASLWLHQNFHCCAFIMITDPVLELLTFNTSL